MIDAEVRDTNGVQFYTLCALKFPVCIKTTVLLHGIVDFCVQYHGLMLTGVFKLFRGMLECSAAI